jgi:5-methyltetrahydrofolate--homocysteine methyltransferase
MELLASLTEATIKGDHNMAVDLTEKAIGDELSPEAVLDALVSAMDRVGERFKNNEIFIPEMLIASRAMKSSMKLLEPLLADAGIKPEYTAIIGTVEGDLHDIGKNLVTMMWKGANFEVIDLGTNVPPDRFVEAVKEHGVPLVALSALLTTTMPAMAETVEALKNCNGKNIQVVVGGAPITQEFADQIGADGYAEDAASAVDVARQLLVA